MKVYLVTAMNYRMHVCNSKDIAESIKQDLISRGATEAILTETDGSLAYDQGGMAFVGEPWIKVPITNGDFSFRPRDIGMFFQHLSDRLERDVRLGKYIKLHCWPGRSLCLDVESAQQVKQHLIINEAKYEKQADEFWQEKMGDLKK